MIQAGAGAGKTTRLVTTFFEYVDEFTQKNGRHPNVVISTFTKKATQELRERLFKFAVENNKLETLRLLQRPSSVHISTLHGLLVPFLSRFGDLAGLNPEIKIISQFQRELNDRRVLKKIFIQNPELMDILEEFSWAELMLGLEIYVQERLLHGRIDFDSLENIESWEKRSFENWNKKRLQIKVEFQLNELNQTWQSYLQEYFSPLESWHQTKNLFDRLPRKPPFRRDKPPFLESLHDDFEFSRKSAQLILKNPLLVAENKLRFQQIHSQFSSLAEEFFKQTLAAKFETGLISMSDLETLSLEILRRHPESAQKFSDNWDFWMLDEYQDTSPIQVEILKSFINKKNEFVVGDPQQSIYLFRGARKEVFQEKIKDMKSSSTQLEVVTINRRSSRVLLGFFNEVFCRLSNDFVSMISPEKDTSPVTSFVKAVCVQKNEGSPQEDGDILVLIQRIQEQIQNGTSPKDIVVLSRTNSDLRKIIHYAKKLKLEVECPSLSDFWKRREIIDLCALVRFLFNPHDNINLLCLLRSPWFYVSDQSILGLSSNESYWLQLKQNETFKQVSAVLIQLIEHAKQWGISSTLVHFSENSDFLWVSQNVDPTGRREANIWKFILDIRAQERISGVNLLEWLDEKERDESTDVSGQSGEAPPLLSPNRVSLMTIHASKGLEFEHVYILGMSDRPQKSKNEIFNFDEKKQMMSLAIRDEDQGWMYSPLTTETRDDFRNREAEESLRWLYVAMTRAKSTLTFIVDSKVESESWWSQFPLPKEEGFHQIGTASYEVIHQPPQELESFSKPQLSQLTKSPFVWSAPLLIKRKSVTELVEDSNKSRSSSLQPVKALKKAQLGTQVHRLFEALTYNQQMEVPEAWKPAVNFVLNLKEPPMKEIFKLGRPEWGFAYRKNNEIIQGAIDLWADLDHAVFLIDYKTGSSDFSDKALNQLKVYAAALRDMKIVENKKPQFLVALYPFEQKFEMIEIL
jgi:ATP-dependent helicase/nuclease subunit A